MLTFVNADVDSLRQLIPLKAAKLAHTVGGETDKNSVDCG